MPDSSFTDPAPVAARLDAVGVYLREETTGGKLLLAATVLALLWANVGSSSYDDAWSFVPLGDWASAVAGPLELQIDLAAWAADGLLALFFFVAGMEVKREFTTGELSDRRAATLPLLAALGGMAVPAAVALAASGGAMAGDGAWAIPVATDIAFALGVLAIAGSSLPAGVRALLLSMAVIDDLIAITLIAVLFTKGFDPLWLAGGLGACGLWWLLWRLRPQPPWALLWALALTAWVCIHASGVHATVTGVLLGLLVPVRADGAQESAAHRLEHRLHPWSAGVAVPVFALAAAGIPLAATGDILGNDIARGVLFGLLAGKFAGVLGGAWLAVRSGLGTLPPGVHWADLVPVALLAGIGYTVSLLIAALSLEPADERAASASVLVASTVAAGTAALLLRRRSAFHNEEPA